jgi:hypothetical protein
LLMAILPKCPLCWIALTGALGFGSFMTVYWMRPIAISLLLLPLSALFLCARRARYYLPFAMATVAAVSMYFWKFVLNVDAAVYLSGLAIFSASLWNVRVMRKVSADIKCNC